MAFVVRLTRANSKIFPYIQVSFTLLSVYILATMFDARWLLLSLFVYFLTGCLGITITFHRYLSHKSFKMSKGMEYFLCVLGSLGCTGSPLGWVAVHKNHHKNSDRAGDPHSPQIYGWRVLFSSYKFDFDKWQVRHLICDKFHLNLHNFYHLWLLLWVLTLWLINTKLLFYGFIIPVTIQLWASNLSNWGNHLYGYRNFATPEYSTNTWWLALITWGEGWHNNHHRYPNRWNFRHKWWELDPSSWIIRLLRRAE